MVHEAVDMFKPDIIVCPFLTKALPIEIFTKYVCLIVHPGILGDSGPSSLDWAMLNKEPVWGVTVLNASEVMDGGDVWACSTFEMPTGISKSTLYKQYVIPAAVEGVFEALNKFQNGIQPTPVSSFPKKLVRGIERHYMKQSTRDFDFATMKASEIVEKCRLSDTQPGILKTFLGQPFYFYGACVETLLPNAATPGEIFAQRDGAICIGCAGGTAVWFSHLRQSKDLNVDKFAGVHPKCWDMLYSCTIFRPNVIVVQ
jgi:putative two-component system hydrogenase maturation factor HypX/HoxX